MKPEVKKAIEAEKNAAKSATPISGAVQSPAKSHIIDQNVVNAQMAKGLDIEIKLPLGRPVNPDSNRQKRLATYDAKKAEDGGLKRGRPRNPESANAIKQAAREARIAALKEAAIKAINANKEAGTTIAGVAMVKTEDGVKPEAVLIEAGTEENKA